MKLPRLVVIAAAAVGAVSAAECTPAQVSAYTQFDQKPFEKACPSLFRKGADVADASQLETFTDASLKALEPCKEKPCITEMKTYYDATPACTSRGFNVKVVIAAWYELCDSFNAGPVSVEAAKSLFRDLDKNMEAAAAAGSLLGGDSGSAADGNSASDEVASNSSSSQVPPAATPGTMPTPAPTTAAKSAASSSLLSSLAVVVSATLASSLVLQ